MPIIGLTDIETRQVSNVSVPLWGKVRKGAEKPERGVGRNLDYFRLDWMNDTAARVYTELFGDDNRAELEITFIGNTVDAVFDTHYRMYGGNNALQRLCDGQTCKRHIVAKDNGELLGYSSDPVACMCDATLRDAGEKGQCEAHGLLYFTIPALCNAVGEVGQFIMNTGSVIEMREMAVILHNVLLNVGHLAGVPFLLRRSPRSFDQVQKGKLVQFEQWMVELVPPIEAVIKSIVPKLNGAPLPQLGTGDSSSLDTETAKKALGSGDTRRVPPAETSIKKGLSKRDMEIVKSAVQRQTGFSLETFFQRLEESVDEEALEPFGTLENVIGDSMNAKDCLHRLLQIMSMSDENFHVFGVRIEKFKKKLRRYVLFFGTHPVYLYGSEHFEEVLPPIWLGNIQKEYEKAVQAGSDFMDFGFLSDDDLGWKEWTCPRLTVDMAVHKDTGEIYFTVREIWRE